MLTLAKAAGVGWRVRAPPCWLIQDGLGNLAGLQRWPWTWQC